MDTDVSHAQALLGGGDPHGAIAILSPRLASARDGEGPRDEAVAAGVVLAQAHAAAGDVAAADAAFVTAAEWAMRSSHGRLGSAGIQLQRASLLGQRVSLRAEIADDLEAVLDAFKEAGQAEPFLRGLALVTRLHLLTHRMDLALDRAIRLGEAARRLGAPYVQALSALYAGLSLEASWHLSAAEDALSQAASADDSDAALRIQASVALARVRARRGHAAKAAEAARAALDAGADPERDLEAAWIQRALLPASPPVSELADMAWEALAAEPAVAETVAEIVAASLPTASDPAGALTVLERFQERLGAIGRRDLATVLCRTGVRLLKRGHRRDQISAYLDTAIAGSGAADTVPACVLRLERARWLHQTDQIAEALVEASLIAPKLADAGLDADAASAWLVVAQALRQSGRLDDAASARAEAERLAARAPLLSTLVTLEAARAARAAGDPERALTLLAAPSDESITALLTAERCEALMDLGRLDAARAAMEAHVDRAEGVPRLQLLVARVRLGVLTGRDAATLTEWLHAATELAGEVAGPTLQRRLAQLITDVTSAQA